MSAGCQRHTASALFDKGIQKYVKKLQTGLLLVFIMIAACRTGGWTKLFLRFQHDARQHTPRLDSQPAGGEEIFVTGVGANAGSLYLGGG